MTANKRILRIDSSGRYNRSISRQLTERLIERLQEQDPNAHVINRDLAQSDLPFVNETMIGGFYTPEDERTQAQRAELAFSNGLVEEFRGADTLVIGLPIYNYGVPAAMKAYIDLIVRSGLTFTSTEDGLVGLLEDKKTYLVVTSGGFPVDSELDLATDHVRKVLGLMGITDVEVIAAEMLMYEAEKNIPAAEAQIDELVGTRVPVLA